MTTTRKVYQELASLIDARANCAKSGNTEWYGKHEDRIEAIISDHMPHGSGFDSGVKLNWERSSSSKLVFSAPYHHMNEGGLYDHWTDYTVIVTPSLVSGFDLRITGRDYNGFKEYAYEVFLACFDEAVTL